MRFVLTPRLRRLALASAAVVVLGAMGALAVLVGLFETSVGAAATRAPLPAAQLKTLVERQGSDLHLSTSTPPQIRVHGRLERLPLPDLGPAETTDGFAQAMQATHAEASIRVRLIDSLGHLVAVAESRTPGLLHPSVVLM